MKTLVKVQEVEGEGLVGLLGQTVLLFCVNYNYAGKLTGVNDTCVKLENAHLVFDTGAFDNSKYTDAQKLNKEFYVRTEAIEAFGVLPAKAL